jgi:hypothetical protein
LQDRIDGLYNEARPDRPRTIGDDGVAAVIERTLRTTPALSRAFYPDIGVMDQSGRALVRRTHAQADTARCPHINRPTRSRYPHLHRTPQRKSDTLQMDQVCRRNPSFRQTLLPKKRTNIIQRTLDSGD